MYTNDLPVTTNGAGRRVEFADVKHRLRGTTIRYSRGKKLDVTQIYQTVDHNYLIPQENKIRYPSIMRLDGAT